MSKILTKGFVMAAFPYRDRDRMLHILTPEHGLISANARGACSYKSRLRPLSNPYSLCDFEFFYYKDRYYVDDGELIESFLSISESIERLTAASHAAEVFRDLTRSSPPDRRYFDLWAYTIYEISQSDIPLLISRLSTLRLLSDAGYAPQLNFCNICQKRISSDAIFSFRSSALLCDNNICDDGSFNKMKLSRGCINLLRHTITAPYNRLFRFQVSNEVADCAAKFLDLYLQDKMEKEYTKLGLLEQAINIDLSTLKRDNVDDKKENTNEDE